MRTSRIIAAAALALGIGGVTIGQADAAAPNTADWRYQRAVADSGFDPADPYWAQYARNTCADLRAGRPAGHISDTNWAYIYGAAVGAYCLEMSDRTWYAR